MPQAICDSRLTAQREVRWKGGGRIDHLRWVGDVPLDTELCGFRGDGRAGMDYSGDAMVIK